MSSNFIMEFIDDKVIDSILMDFFGIRISINNLDFKKRKLSMLLFNQERKNLVKKYRARTNNIVDTLIIESAMDELKDKSEDELLYHFTTKEGMKIHNFYKICTMIVVAPELVKENYDKILINLKNNQMLFGGIYTQNMAINSDEKSIAYLEHLNDIIRDLNSNIEKVKSFQKSLEDKNEALEKEVKKLKRDFTKSQDKVKSYEKNNKNLDNELAKSKTENKNLIKNINKKESEIKSLNNKNKELNEELSKSKLDFRLDKDDKDFKLGIIHTFEFKFCHKLYPDVKFIDYSEINKRYNPTIMELKRNNISNIILQTNNLSTYDVCLLRNKLKSDNFNVIIELLKNERSAIKVISNNIDM